MVRRALTLLLAAALFTGITAVLSEHSALAADDFVPSTTVARASWGYIDQNTPHRGYLNPPGDAPVGAWRDGRGDHRARSYFTFDIAQFRGKRIVDAALTARETHANDCRFRAVQLWETDPFTATSSWRRPPSEHRLLGSSGVPASGCLVENEAFGVSQAIRRALDRGRSTITVALRVPEDMEGAAKYGRRFANDPTLSVTYNTPPLPPTDLGLGWQPCSAEAPGQYTSTYTEAKARIPEDPDGTQDELQAHFALWPTDEPSARHERTIDVYPHWPYASFALHPQFVELDEGRTYAWSIQTDDGTDTSAWTAPCYLTIDNIRPAEPAVTSTDYPGVEQPAGDVGLPGRFTLSAGGVADVVGFLYGRYSADTYVAADRLGGSATITFTPTDSGHQSITVVSLDRAGHASPPYEYYFWVRESRPLVTSDDYPDYAASGGIGIPGDIHFSRAHAEPVTEYVYQFDGAEPRTVPADADGRATITFTPTRGGEHVLTVRGRDEAGALGAVREYRFVVETAPTFFVPWYELVGAPSTISVTPGMPGVVEYDYWFGDDESAARTVPADADGTATIDWLPTLELHGSDLNVRSRSADGSVSAVRQQFVYLDLAEPEIVRDGGGRPGEPGTFAVSSRMPNVTEYHYWFNDDRSDVRTVPALPDGTAVIDWTPPADGQYIFHVQASNATGAFSGMNYEIVDVYSAPYVSSDDYPEWRYAGGVGVPGEFTFRPNMPNVVEYVYTAGAHLPPEPETIVVPAGPDGSATVTFTPTVDGYNEITVRSRSADGTLSGERRYVFIVNWEERAAGLAAR